MSSTQLVSKSRETPCTGVLNIAIVHALCVCERAFSALYGAHRRLYEWGRRRHNRHCKRRVLQLAVDERFRRSLSVLFSRCSFESTSAEKDFSFFFFFLELLVIFVVPLLASCKHCCCCCSRPLVVFGSESNTNVVQTRSLLSCESDLYLYNFLFFFFV